jgi:hypothetical protein
VAVGARRRAAAARRRLHERVREVAEDEVLAPLERTRADHDLFRAAVARAAG